MPGLFWQPFFPPLPVIGAGVALLLLASLACARRARVQPGWAAMLLVMRLVLIVALTILLLGPSTMTKPTRTGTRAGLRVLLDTSASMQTADVNNQPRYEAASQQWLSADRLAALRDRFDIALFGFDDGLARLNEQALRSPAADAATGRHTKLFTSVRASLDAMHGSNHNDPSALLLLSDGRDTTDHTAASVARLARTGNVRIHTVALGGPNRQRDLRLTAHTDQPYLFAGETGRIRATLTQTNSPHARTTLRLTSAPNNSTQTSDSVTRPVAFKGQRQIEVTLPIHHDEPGTYRYDLSLDALPHEASQTNNSQPVFVRVTGERVNVLLLEGAPYWDTKFLAHALRRDERVSLRQITQLTQRRREQLVTRAEPAGGVPTSLSELRPYDVIIVGRALSRVLPTATARLLPKYVTDHGGRLVFARSRAHEPNTDHGRAIADALSRISPVIWGRGVSRDVSMQLTERGRAHPVFQSLAMQDARSAAAPERQMPTLESLSAVRRIKPATRILARAGRHAATDARAQPAPAIVTMPAGRGMVMAVLGQGLWRWRLASQQDAAPAGAFDRFWTGAVRWLAMGSAYRPGEPLSLRLSRRALPIDDTLAINVVRRFPDAQTNANVTVTSPDGEKTRLDVSASDNARARSGVEFTPRTAGIHKVTLRSRVLDAPQHARFSVYNVDEERVRSGADPHSLRHLARASGGRFFNSNESDQLLTALVRDEAAQNVPARPAYVWPRAWIMILLVGWAGAEWLLRRKAGWL